MEVLDNEEKGKKSKIKIKHIILVFLPGLMLTMVGALFKIQSWEGGGMMITIGTLIKVFAVILGLIKMMGEKNKNSIFNQ